MHLANERRRYNVNSSLIGWAHSQNDACKPVIMWYIPFSIYDYGTFVIFVWSFKSIWINCIIFCFSILAYISAFFALYHFIYYFPRIMCMLHALSCFVVIKYLPMLPITFAYIYKKYPRKTHQTQSLAYPYHSGFLHRHWGNHVIAPVPVREPWRIWVNKSDRSIRNMWYFHNKTKHNKTMHIFYGKYSILMA